MPAIAAVLAGAGLLLLPTRSRGSAAARPAGSGGSVAGPGPARRSRVLAGAAAVLAGLALVVVLGTGRGLVAAGVVVPAVAVGAGRWLRRPVADRPDRTVALTLDLAAAALRSGRPAGDALLLAAPAARSDLAVSFERAAHLLRLGADPSTAWAAIGPGSGRGGADGGALAPVVTVAVRSASSGIRLAGSFERLAVDLRAELAAAAAARANRAGVAAMGPLAACFLPSFVCLGIVPVIVGIARTAFHGLG
jgi:hypothetical protein